MLLQWPGSEIWANEIKRSLKPKLERGVHSACADVRPALNWLIYSGKDAYPMAEGVTAVPLASLMHAVAAH